MIDTPRPLINISKRDCTLNTARSRSFYTTTFSSCNCPSVDFCCSTRGALWMQLVIDFRVFDRRDWPVLWNFYGLYYVSHDAELCRTLMRVCPERESAAMSLLSCRQRSIIHTQRRCDCTTQRSQGARILVVGCWKED